MGNVISIENFKSDIDSVRLKIDYIDQEINELQIEQNNLVPYKVGEIFKVNKKLSEEYHHQSHPREYNYEEPIIDCVDLDNDIEFWVSYGQLRGLVGQYG